MRKIILYFAILSIMIWPLAFVSSDFEQNGKHSGEVKELKYLIEYIAPKGVTTVDSSGITFKPFIFGWSFLAALLPAKYFGDYPLYSTGDTLNFKVHLKNVGKRTFRNIKIIAFQEFFNADGGQGSPISSNNGSDWFLVKLGPGEEIVLDGVFEIPLFGESGLDQTHLQILHWANGESFSGGGGGRIIIDDPQAGIWCPIL